MKPGEIRVIRELLGLTQREAGELLGGGPSAFAKYESGTVKPSAAVVRLLELLKADPSAVSVLRGDPPVAKPLSLPLAYEVTSEHISMLDQRKFPHLLRLILHAEALASGLPPDGIHVTSAIHVADGGEDGRIEWKGGLERTAFLPSRLSQFQLKAGKIAPAEAASDVLKKDGEVKRMVRSALEERGHYIMLCAHPYTEQQIEARERRIREAIRGAGVVAADEQISFRDADQIALWINQHPAVASWVLEHLQPGLLGPFHSWSHWASRKEHGGLPWVEDERLGEFREFLHARVAIATPGAIGRVVGLAGIGKSRLALEALRSSAQASPPSDDLPSLVLYAVEPEGTPGAIPAAVQRLADSGARAIVVVDRCAPETHRVLAGMITSDSHLSLLTLDDEIPSGTLDDQTLRVVRAPSTVTQAIIDNVAPGLPSQDQRRLVLFARGFPEVAIRIAQAWLKATPLAHATDDDLVDTFVLGRNPREPELQLKSAALLATFGLVGVEPPLDAKLGEIASLGRDLSINDIRAGTNALTVRGVARQRGRYASIEPRPIAMRLAERQWQEWGPETWDEVLTKGSSRFFVNDLPLNTQAAKQLALLNTLPVSREVVRHVCRYGGRFDRLDGLLAPGHTEVLSCLAEIDTSVVVAQIERSLTDVEDLLVVDRDARRHLVWTLEKIAFDSETFESGARVLVRLAAAENETWANNATGQFIALFPMFLGGTEADGVARLSFLDEVMNSNDPAHKELAVSALARGLELDHFARTAGAETHGTRPALESWRPATSHEATEYIAGCVQRFTALAVSDDEVRTLAQDSLGQALDDLVRHGFIDVVETVVEEVGTVVSHWPRALNGLQLLIEHFDTSMDPSTIDRVRALTDKLQPRSLETRIRFLVTDMPWEYLGGRDVGYEEQLNRQKEAIRLLAEEAIGDPQVLLSLLPQLSRGQQRMNDAFGQAIGELSESWEDWLEPILRAVSDAPEPDRHFGLLVGYIGSINKDEPAIVEALKRESAESPILAPALPLICATVPTPDGIAATDIKLLVVALEAGFLSPRWLRWDTVGRALRDAPPEVAAPLFDAMLDHSAQGFEAALDLIGLYTHDKRERLESLRPQVCKIAENVTRWKWGEQMASYNFEQIMAWMLDKGRKDSAASATALTLAQALAGVEDYDRTHPLKPVVPTLLAKFPEVSWAIIGQAVVSADPVKSFLLESVLGEWTFGHRRENYPLLSLPVDTLFAWCHAHPDRAPAFAAKIVPVLENNEPGSTIHPVLIRLIEEFGDRKDVDDAIAGNMHTGGWTGPEEGYWTPYQEPVGKLLEHPSPKVRKWAKATLRWLSKTIDAARTRDAEEEALFGE